MMCGAELGPHLLLIRGDVTGRGDGETGRETVEVFLDAVSLAITQ